MSSTASAGGTNTNAMPPPRSTPVVREKCTPAPITKFSRRIQSTNVNQNPHVHTPDGETPLRRKKRLSRIRAYNSRYKKNGAFIFCLNLLLHTIHPFNFADSQVDKNAAQSTSSAQTPRVPAAVRRAARPLFKRTTNDIDGAKFERAKNRLNKHVKRIRNAADYEDDASENGTNADSCPCSCNVQGVRHSRCVEHQLYGSCATNRSTATIMCATYHDW